MGRQPLLRHWAATWRGHSQAVLGTPAAAKLAQSSDSRPHIQRHGRAWPVRDHHLPRNCSWHRAAVRSSHLQASRDFSHDERAESHSRAFSSRRTPAATSSRLPRIFLPLPFPLPDVETRCLPHTRSSGKRKHLESRQAPHLQPLIKHGHSATATRFLPRRPPHSRPAATETEKKWVKPCRVNKCPTSSAPSSWPPAGALHSTASA